MYLYVCVYPCVNECHAHLRTLQPHLLARLAVICSLHMYVYVCMCGCVFGCAELGNQRLLQTGVILIIYFYLVKYSYVMFELLITIASFKFSLPI